MVTVYGKSYAPRELGAHMGELAQVAGMRAYTQQEGKARGVRGIDVWTGSGFQFTVLPDRGLDISDAKYCGKSLCWRSTTGDVHPHAFEPEGFGWLRGFFGGLLTTCGLTYVGAPCEDEGEQLGLHGRISHIPAEVMGMRRHWKDDRYCLEVEGEVQESVVFGANLVLCRKIFTYIGESRLWVHDVVENRGYQTSPLMIAYHINVGFPVLSPESYLMAVSDEVTPRDAEAEKGKEAYAQCEAPSPGYDEKVYYHDLKPDPKGQVRCALVNPSCDGDALGFYELFRKDQLPYLAQWKEMSQGEYVMGMEPANCLVGGRNEERAAGRLQFIEPGQSMHFNLELGVLAGQAQVEEFRSAMGSS